MLTVIWHEVNQIYSNRLTMSSLMYPGGSAFYCVAASASVCPSPVLPLVIPAALLDKLYFQTESKNKI